MMGRLQTSLGGPMALNAN